MSTETVYKCTICDKSLSSKYTLVKHLMYVHRCSEENEEMTLEELKCPAQKCSYSTVYSNELKRHSKKCQFILTEREISTLMIQHEKELALCQEEIIKLNIEKQAIHVSYEEITKLRTENEILQRELEKAQDMIRSFTEHAINRPTTTTNNQQNIGSVKVTNYLTDYETYQKQTDPDRVRALLDQHFEEYFFDGQLGLAQLNSW